MRWYKTKESKLYWRWWLHFSHRNSINIDLNCWTNFCHLDVGVDDEGWKFSIAFPPIALWIKFCGFGLWRPQVKHIFTWDNNREVWLTDKRELSLSVHDWTVCLSPWGRWGEWRAKDPWWIRGVSFDIKDFLLGRTKHESVTGETFDIQVPMLEGEYHGKATIEHCTWKRPRWRAFKRSYARVDMAEMIPFPGKGESSYDCGMSGLCGFSVESWPGRDMLSAIACEGMKSAMESRRKYAGSAYWVPEKDWREREALTGSMNQMNEKPATGLVGDLQMDCGGA